ncbi:TRISR-like protein [Mya arenaria]|uniref:TRISR-like protein n=1 Tax=Mya arenaria TaxID=6604 RepID=A0ABY7FUH7_MYAAR|nr:TRISR-like protein [Mya arenaria]
MLGTAWECVRQCRLALFKSRFCIRKRPTYLTLRKYLIDKDNDVVFDRELYDNNILLAGNLMVLFAIVRSPRLKSNTNFFLANLAIADFCVGIFCVLPNLSTFLNPTWVLGKVMCKIYYYIWNVSYIASIFILTVIAVERYGVIMHPLNSRHFMTRSRVKIIQMCIWIIALIYNIPYAILYETLSVGKDNFCYATEDNEIKLKWLSVATLVLWYIIPLFVIVILYYQIARALWKTQVVSALRLSTYHDNDTRCVITSSAFSPVWEHNEHTRETNLSNRSSLTGRSNVKQVKERYHLVQVASTRWVAKARQRVIRLLLCVVVTFAVCVFPHMMKVFDHYWAVFNISHSAMLILSPISFLILYLNSVLNPFLYAMFSTNFRKSFKEVIPTFCQGLFKGK